MKNEIGAIFNPRFTKGMADAPVSSPTKAAQAQSQKLKLKNVLAALYFSLFLD